MNMYPGFLKYVKDKGTFRESRVGVTASVIKPTKRKVNKAIEEVLPAKEAMPVVAVVFAAYAVSAAVAVTTVLSVITAIGAVVTAIGAVTGNEKLTKIGGVISLVGAVGSLASSLGSISGEAAASTLSEAAADEAAQSATNAAITETSPIVDQALPEVATGAAQTAAPEVANTASEVANTAASSAVPESANTLSASQQVADSASQNGILGGALESGPSGTPAPVSVLDKTPVSPATGVVDTPFVAGNPPPMADLAGSASTGATGNSFFGGAFDKISEFIKPVTTFAKDNPNLTASLLQGVASAADPSQRDLREAQTNATNVNAAYQQQLINNQKSAGGPLDWQIDSNALSRIYSKKPSQSGILGGRI